MKEKLFENKEEKSFILISGGLSLVIALLYILKGFTEQFYAGTYVVIASALIYVPVIWIFRRPGFTFFNLIYSVVLVFIIAFNQTYLYNNFTGLLAVFIVMMIWPKFKIQAAVLYFISVSIAFGINNESLLHYFIHITRGAWLFHIFNHILVTKYQRRKLILYDDEIQILKELSKNKLQKSIDIDGLSESTIYRRLKAASKRNNLTKNQLIEQFKLEYDNPTEK